MSSISFPNNSFTSNKSRRLLLQAISIIASKLKMEDLQSKFFNEKAAFFNSTNNNNNNISDVLELAADIIMDLSEFESDVIRSNLDTLRTFLPIVEFGYTRGQSQLANDELAFLRWGRVRAGFCNILR